VPWLKTQYLTDRIPHTVVIRKTKKAKKQAATPAFPPKEKIMQKGI
jgi:hypothetical protein